MTAGNVLDSTLLLSVHESAWRELKLMVLLANIIGKKLLHIPIDGDLTTLEELIVSKIFFQRCRYL